MSVDTWKTGIPADCPIETFVWLVDRVWGPLSWKDEMKRAWLLDVCHGPHPIEYLRLLVLSDRDYCIEHAIRRLFQLGAETVCDWIAAQAPGGMAQSDWVSLAIRQLHKSSLLCVEVVRWLLRRSPIPFREQRHWYRQALLYHEDPTPLWTLFHDECRWDPHPGLYKLAHWRHGESKASDRIARWLSSRGCKRPLPK
jgi:hypothetical protein